ncbi:MAG: dihydropyrimidine dehydrogenase, partial [Gracilibacteraceae bacterium]|nr:dihydropyrimidine dehydrogenase [Gracilibacteraceae bacterium]
MANKSQVKTPIPELQPELRITNFSEVALGYTLEQAKEEADRCLSCKKSPCVAGCPVGV